MYVRATSPRLSRGKSTPATRAIFAPSQPWRWLCRGFLQMTRTTPDRRTILQFSQRTLTDGRTFTTLLPTLFEPICDPAAGQIVRRQLDLDPVTGKNADEVHAHLAAYVGEHPVAVLQLHAEHRVRQGLDHGALDLDRVLFGHAAVLRPSGSVLRVRISGPSSVTATVCSKCAARLPSTVTAVHRSSRTRTSQLPIVTIGSIASAMPGWRGTPVHHLVVDRRADGGRKAAVALERRRRATGADEVLDLLVDLLGRQTGFDPRREPLRHLGQDVAGRAHQGELARGLQQDHAGRPTRFRIARPTAATSPSPETVDSRWRSR